MSLDLPLVSLVMYLKEGEINPGDEGKVVRFEKKMSDWRRDVIVGDSKNLTREDMTSNMCQVENGFVGYWCEGAKCLCARTHWVLQESESFCWDCMHDPCACSTPLVWDATEQAYSRFFLSCDGKTKKNVWMSKPIGSMATIKYKRGEKKRKERENKEKEEENCADNQKRALNCGYCCHQHAKVAKMEHEESKRQKTKKETVKKMIDGPDHCIHCDEDPCLFIQIESRLWENDEIYYDKGDYDKDPAAYNSGRRKRAYQYAAFVLWEGINYRKPHYRCVEDGVRALFPPVDGKIMGYKTS